MYHPCGPLIYLSKLKVSAFAGSLLAVYTGTHKTNAIPRLQETHDRGHGVDSHLIALCKIINVPNHGFKILCQMQHIVKMEKFQFRGQVWVVEVQLRKK